MNVRSLIVHVVMKKRDDRFRNASRTNKEIADLDLCNFGFSKISMNKRFENEILNHLNQIWSLKFVICTICQCSSFKVNDKLPWESQPGRVPAECARDWTAPSTKNLNHVFKCLMNYVELLNEFRLRTVYCNGNRVETNIILFEY